MAKRVFSPLGLLILLAALSPAQTVSSSITGVVLDASGAAIVGADVTLTNNATGAAFSAKTATDGGFTFPNLLAGRYLLTAKTAGFKTLETKDIVISSGEVRALGSLTLQVGEVKDSVSVEAAAVAVQTSSSEKSGLVTGTQLNDIAVRGRDFFTYLGTIPGVVDNFSQRRETASPDADRKSVV